jgi:hypothetical protein
MGVAIAMLLKSLELGRYHIRYHQFKMIRKLRAGFSNVYITSVEGVLIFCTVGGDWAKHHLTMLHLPDGARCKAGMGHYPIGHAWVAAASGR